jgi:hypothetical protein
MVFTPENITLHNHCCDNLKSNMHMMMFHCGSSVCKLADILDGQDRHSPNKNVITWVNMLILTLLFPHMFVHTNKFSLIPVSSGVKYFWDIRHLIFLCLRGSSIQKVKVMQEHYYMYYM